MYDDHYSYEYLCFGLWLVSYTTIDEAPFVVNTNTGASGRTFYLPDGTEGRIQ
jgi:hypothetical protein